MGGQQMIGIEGQVCVQLLLCVWKVPSHIYLVSWARLSPVHLRSRIPAHHITECWILSDPEDRGVPNIHDYPQKEPYPWNRWIVHLDSRAMKVSTWNYYDNLHSHWQQLCWVLFTKLGVISSSSFLTILPTQGMKDKLTHVTGEYIKIIFTWNT